MTSALAGDRTGSIQTSDQALRASFLIAGRAIDLPGEVKAGDPVRLQAVVQLTGVNEIILYSITRLWRSQRSQGPGWFEEILSGRLQAS